MIAFGPDGDKQAELKISKNGPIWKKGSERNDKNKLIGEMKEADFDEMIKELQSKLV